MKRVWRNGGRVLSAILAAAMIFTSLPVSGVTVYADEATPQAVVTEADTENSAGTVADEETSLEGETGGGSETPAEGEPPADEGQTAESGTPADDETPFEGDTPAEDETPAEGDTTPEDEETPTEDEIVLTDETTTEDELVIEDEATSDIVEEEISTVSDGDATPESDFTWNGTTIKKYTGTATSVVIPANATAIGNSAFAGNTTIESVRFAGGPVELGEKAFNSCTNLKYVELPLMQETIGGSSAIGSGGYVFAHCTALEEIRIPVSVKTIGYGAFYGCTALEKVTLSSGLETIAGEAFDKCSALKEIILPDTVKNINNSAFKDCAALTEICVPASLTKVSTDAFENCTNLTHVEYAEGTTTTLQIGATYVEEVVLPDSVTTIGSNTFSNCTRLERINLPEGLKNINYSAFYKCTSLSALDLPDTLESIGSRAFWYCTGLTEICIPPNVSNTKGTSENESTVFDGCTGLQYLEYAEGTTTVLGVGAVYAKTIKLPSSAKAIGYEAFYNYTELERIEIPDSVETIGGCAFEGCTSLTWVHVSAGLAGDSWAFPGCTSLEYMEFGEGMTAVPRVYAPYVRTVVLPSTVRVIRKCAFMGLENLTTINLPASLESIEYEAFYHHPDWQVTELRFEGDGDIDINTLAFDCSGDVTRDVPVYCAAGSKVYDYFNGREGFIVVSTNSIKYVLNGGINNPANPGSYTTGDDLTFLDPTRLGYTFQGWYTDSKFTNRFIYDKTKTNGNLTLYAKWSEITYSIKYDLGGGALPKGKTNPTTYVASKDVTLVAPTKVGAAFTGWKVNNTDVIITNSKIAKGSYGENLVLTAQWREYAYQIIWNKNAKDAVGAMDTVTVSYSEEYTIPEEGYTRAGYDFLGWNTSANGKGKSYVEGDVVQGLATKEGAKVTLYAQWQKSIYEIVYVMNDSETSPAVNHKSNPDSYSVAQKVKLQNPTRTGYLFDGWYTDVAYTEKVTQITSAMGDVTVYAKWTPITYTIVFNANKGTLPAGPTRGNLTATYDTEATLWTNAFVRSGYTFLGWDTTANSKAAEPVYKDGAKVLNLTSKNKAKVTLYAKWQINQIPITYVLNDTEEDPATNSSKNPAYVTIAKNVVLAAPTRAGYKFGGWYTDEALKTPLAKNTIAKTTTDPVTVYASWIENSYTLKLDKNGGTYDIPKEVDGKLVVGKHEYEDEFLLPDGTGASRTNYEFTGWNTKKDRSGKHYGLNPETGENESVSGLATKGTVTLYAEWTPIADKTYTITYHGIDDSWDNSKNPSVYSFEKDIKLANPTKTGYTFKGWYAENPSENPKAKKVTSISKKSTANIELYGVWTENSYTIAYNGNKGTLPKGVKMAAQSVLYSQEATLTTNAFTRKGYEFDGWNTKANGKGTKVDGTVGNYADGEAVRSLTARNKGKVTLYAQWKAIDYSITYVGAENGVDGVVNTNPTTYTIAKDVKLVNPTAYGYTFKGWYNDDPETNAKAKKVTKIAKTTCKNMTVYALWSENKYNLRFSTNSLFGSSVKSVTNRLYTEEFNIPATIPTKEGCTFQGWALTRDGEAIFHAGDEVTFADIHEAGGTAKGLVGTKYFTLYAVFAEE